MTTPATPAAPTLKKTALNATHRALKAKMVDFGGWDMPVEYPGNGGGLIAEHLAVRTGVGLFDVSHMGEIQFRGPGALAAVQHITMNDASKLKDGQAHYSALLTPSGAFVDDILVHRLGENDYLLVVNAGTTEKDYAWIRKQVGGFPGVHISDYSPHYSQLAVQGPRALETLKKLTKVDLAVIKNYWFTWGTVANIPNVLIARTGYSGEDGFEVYIPSDEATTVKMWDALMDAGSEFAIRPCGLGARNTLRLEAGMSLYGHEISEEINAFEGGLDRWLKLDKGYFIGRDALLAVQSAGGPKRKVIGLEMIDRGIARDGYSVFDLEGKEIGVVTSGSPAPFLKTNIALALVPTEVAASGSDLFVQCRANPVRAKQVPIPFYKRPKAKPETL
ncbi:glycine cleavage system aminomethyltransferase GcvT [Terracidiphilus gabretensis]|uniref:glycine cleavage system aminomethyltransferase GcvT n=1 Tax=Terracidiphilus gabretensis TaxID=1577687 RepID=UPI00071C1205|nr:glycine cleavage system aminomethyltransferase GcvT [Terracidiphilus gabretensis]